MVESTQNIVKMVTYINKDFEVSKKQADQAFERLGSLSQDLSLARTIFQMNNTLTA